ncbi:hypothetical protein PRUPE_8G001800 [Prunus persica]|uniref:Uncharacterized protein n=1 Tax=Prunus persica TaxID=3760 RepID=A0A251MQD7_PRUPE|nr:hypothetical protein PRUPE_8G001800 [Prunus persica]
MWGSDYIIDLTCLLRMQLFGRFGILDGLYSESVGKSHRHVVNHLLSIRLRNSLTGRVDGACIMPLILLVNQLPKFDGVYLSCMWFLYFLWISGRFSFFFFFFHMCQFG